MSRAIVAALGLLCACRAPPPGASGVAWGPLIDAHTHAEFTGEREAASGIPVTEAEYFRELAAAGAVGAITHTSTGGNARAPDLRARGVLRCGGVAATPDVAALEEGLASGRYACLKVYLGYVHQYASDPAYAPAYALAARHRVPVVFHTGDTYDPDGLLKYADPLTLDEVAVAHREVQFVIAHCGNPWSHSAAEVAYKNANVTLECSALLIGDLSDEAKVERYLVEPVSWILGYVEDPTKLMFGSDWPLVDIAAYAEVYRRAIPPEHQRAVFFDNAARVFGWRAP